MSTTIIQTILLGLLGLFSNAEWFLGTCYIQRPLILGPLRSAGGDYYGSNYGVSFRRRIIHWWI